MIDIPYVECTCASLSALKAFNDAYPGHERAAEVARAIEGGRRFIASAQRPDGSWYGSWGCCFTYGCWFGLEGLVAGAETGRPLFFEFSLCLSRACLGKMMHFYI
eukprot:COSAG06_NODE_18058_length_905_cov_73.593052_2_plen_105_part_00